LKKILVYSHDTYGLGNIRRMLAITNHIAAEFKDASVLLISGSPLIQSFRLEDGVDYIKLPCLARDETGTYGARSLRISYRRILALRADLILNAFLNFEPDLVLVDKKPLGVRNELAPTLEIMRRRASNPKLVLILRDVLDSPAKTINIWHKNNYHETVAELYDRVLILGSPDIFDTVKEYDFPPQTAEKSYYCGYINKAKKANGGPDPAADLPRDHRGLLLVTAGGGEDGERVFNAVLDAVDTHGLARRFQPFLILGPELNSSKRKSLECRADELGIDTLDFSNEFLSYLQAANVVVSMGGYNTVTEILALKKRAVVIPRNVPVAEQLIRARALASLGLLQMIEPDAVNALTLCDAIERACTVVPLKPQARGFPPMNGLEQVAAHLRSLLDDRWQFGWGKLEPPRDQPDSAAGDLLQSVPRISRSVIKET